jgi:predicted RNA-binding protein with RPS1 domain
MQNLRATTKESKKVIIKIINKGKRIHIKCSIKMTKDRKSGRQKKEEQGQQIENTNKYGRYYLSYIHKSL